MGNDHDGSGPIQSAPGRGEEGPLRIVAPNPGPMTLEGTNTYLVGSDPCLVIDPGPAEPRHLELINREAEARGGIGGILSTHSHLDHTEAIESIDAPLLWGSDQAHDEAAQLAGARVDLEIEAVRFSDPGEPQRVRSLIALPTPGHAVDHVCFIQGSIGFCGDLLLGYGSTIVPPRAAGGSLADYMASLDRLEAAGCELLCPGHGPWIEQPAGRIAEQRSHRLEREQSLRQALAAGVDKREELLSRAWSDVPAELQPAAALSLQAHLEKLAGEGLDLSAVEAG